jgi:hypothetical protein
LSAYFPAVSLQQIASLLGYSEISAFNHAFKALVWHVARPGQDGQPTGGEEQYSMTILL